MPRNPNTVARCALAAITLALLPGAATPQTVGTQPTNIITSKGVQRQFPATSKLGVFAPDVFPQARIDGIAVMLSASARIFDRSNFLVLPQTLMGGQYRVRYTVDLEGRPDRLWLLTEAESADAR